MEDKESRPIVADSSPLISAARANKLQLIQQVYGKLIVPPAVYRELVAKGAGKPGAEEIESASWITVQEPTDQKEVERIRKRLDPGESESLVLAQELSATLLADEKAVIEEARKSGLKIASTHLLLEEAKRHGLIASVKEALDEYIASGFRTTPELIHDSLKKVGEE